MKFDPNIPFDATQGRHHRRSVRLRGYDYSQAGLYFVTIVTFRRECLFGEIENGEMKLNRYGEIVQWEWLELPKRLRYIELGAFSIMPNHFHGILIFNDSNVRATHQGFGDALASKAPLQNTTTNGIDGSPLQQRGPQPASLGAIMAQFKSRVTKRLWKNPDLNGTPIWQRNYYEHIIRNETEMDTIWRYIESNPAMWH
jgi:REP element-mobilizing transposase RayT